MKVEFTETKGDEGSFTLHCRWSNPAERAQCLDWAAHLVGADDHYPDPVLPRFGYENPPPPAPEPPSGIQGLAFVARALRSGWQDQELKGDAWLTFVSKLCEQHFGKAP